MGWGFGYLKLEKIELLKKSPAVFFIDKEHRVLRGLISNQHLSLQTIFAGTKKV